MPDDASLPTIEANGFILGMTLLIDAVGEKESYDAADHAKAGLPMILSCTRCTGRMAGAAARLYPGKPGSGTRFRAYGGICT